MGNFSRSKPEDHFGVDMVQLASWMDVDDNWLRHVLQYEFSCGCSAPDPEVDNHCNIWKAIIDKQRAEENLSKAIAELEKVRAETKGMEVGR